VVVIPADREIRFLPAGAAWTNQTAVYLVPPARMQEILRALGEPDASASPVTPTGAVKANP
jgi:hypothetical protein